MQELTQDEFRHHGVVSSALNHHLFNHMVLISVHEATLKRIEMLESQVKTVQSENHSLVNHYKDTDKRITAVGQNVNGRNGGGGGGGGRRGDGGGGRCGGGD